MTRARFIMLASVLGALFASRGFSHAHPCHQHWVPSYRSVPAAYYRMGDSGVYHKGKSIKIGQRKFEVVRRLGHPTWQEEREKKHLRRIGKYVTLQFVVKVAEWTYNPGSQSFVRTFRFENGEVTHIETGEYGF